MATALMPRGGVLSAGNKYPDSGAWAPGDVLPLQERRQTMITFPLSLQSGERDSALPSQVLFAALKHPALRLRQAIPLRAERSENGISVIWDEIEEFGFGTTFSDAMSDFAVTVAELYLGLNDADELSEHLRTVRAKLSDYIGVRQLAQ